MRPTDRPTTPNEACTHPRVTHVHGTLACARKDGCACTPCTDAARRYEKRRVHGQTTGRTLYVDATPARTHLQSLLDQGMSVVELQHASGINRTVLRNIIGAYGPPAVRIRPETAAAILACRGRAIPEHGLVPGHGTARRLQALVAIGWTKAELAVRLGRTRANIWRAFDPTAPVLAATHRAVCDLYDQLWDQTPPEVDQRSRHNASRARNMARTNGWLPPLAWDDDTIDDPEATGDPGTAPSGRPGRPAIDLHEADWLRAGGVTIDDACRRLGCTRGSLERAAMSVGRRDLAAWARPPKAVAA